MCLINFQIGSHPEYKLIVAANRDEYYKRPTAPAHFWKDAPSLLAGRDLVQLGTWLGITKEGRFAALTNYRQPNKQQTHTKSRGAIVADYLQSKQDPVTYLQALQQHKTLYSGFNVIVGNADKLWYLNNLENNIEPISSGIHALSNHFLDTPWPKVKYGKKILSELKKESAKLLPERLFHLLENTEIANQQDLPDTGVGLELEKQLSPLFIQTPHYGTRSATVLLINHNHHVQFYERTYEQGKLKDDVEFSFQITT
ncbi:NRDE family protein [Ornithinibacillus gellani]|uniref:NRDE family protein n=1 Tax=Ornithinibacillus gellani TaxID=2293253 RepID=UPI000F47BCF7|nr:NRDE family protein [Ornithinibacillus gellani]TQS76538.1 NRDE family protein [Ornithinibacillus gellani]